MLLMPPRRIGDACSIRPAAAGGPQPHEAADRSVRGLGPDVGRDPRAGAAPSTLDEVASRAMGRRPVFRRRSAADPEAGRAPGQRDVAGTLTGAGPHRLDRAENLLARGTLRGEDQRCHPEQHTRSRVAPPDIRHRLPPPPVPYRAPRRIAGPAPTQASPPARSSGGVAEWLKAHAWKVCIPETVSRVRIPLPPPRPKSL